MLVDVHTVRTAVRVEGVVQGVGFRPFVYALATGLGLTGLVGNDLDGVFAEVEGPAAAVSEFLRRLERDAPPLARIERVTTRAVTPAPFGESFVIAASDAGSGCAAPWSRRTPRPARTACASSADPADRRHKYPFINCTNCGPRFTIVRDVPYDRPLTTMAPFAMCERCAAEYHDPADRRFHAQPDLLPGLRPPAGPADRRRRQHGPAPGGRRTPPPRPHPRRQGPGRLPPGRRRRLRAGRRPRCARASTARTSRSRSWPPTWPRPRQLAEVDADGRGPADQPGPPDRAAAAPKRSPAPPSRPPPHRATASSASCCPTPRCTTCCSQPWPARSS